MQVIFYQRVFIYVSTIETEMNIFINMRTIKAKLHEPHDSGS